MRLFIFIMMLIFLFSCKSKDIDQKKTYSYFKNNIDKEMKYDKIIEIFGEPDKNIGSGISIFVYKLNDKTEIWIGYTDRILYIKHFSENQKELDSLLK